MNDLEFSFEPSPWEAYLLNKGMGSRIPAADFLTMLEGEAEEAVEDALQALETGCTKIQLFSPFFNRYREELGQDCVAYMVEKAHKCGVICSLCIADDPELTKDYLAKGVDTLLTNRAQLTQTLRDRYVKANGVG